MTTTTRLDGGEGRRQGSEGRLMGFLNSEDGFAEFRRRSEASSKLRLVARALGPLAAPRRLLRGLHGHLTACLDTIDYSEKHGLLQRALKVNRGPRLPPDASAARAALLLNSSRAVFRCMRGFSGVPMYDRANAAAARYAARAISRIFMPSTHCAAPSVLPSTTGRAIQPRREMRGRTTATGSRCSG